MSRQYLGEREQMVMHMWSLAWLYICIGVAWNCLHTASHLIIAPFQIDRLLHEIVHEECSSLVLVRMCKWILDSPLHSNGCRILKLNLLKTYDCVFAWMIDFGCHFANSHEYMRGSIEPQSNISFSSGLIIAETSKAIQHNVEFP